MAVAVEMLYPTFAHSLNIIVVFILFYILGIGGNDAESAHLYTILFFFLF
jgi:hypothetical protein